MLDWQLDDIYNFVIYVMLHLGLLQVDREYIWWYFAASYNGLTW